MKLSNRRTDVSHSLTRNAVVCQLTGRRFGFKPFDSKSKAEALDKLAEESGRIIDSNNRRAGRTLSLREHMEMMKGEFAPDPRPLSQQIMEDAEVRDNREPNPGNQIRNAMQGVDPDHKFWKSPERQAALQRIETEARREDELEAARIADEQRRSHPMFQNAMEDAELTARLTATDPNATEAEIAAALQRLEMLETCWTVEQYWEQTRAAEKRPADKEAEFQRQADGLRLADELRKRNEEADE